MAATGSAGGERNNVVVSTRAEKNASGLASPCTLALKGDLQLKDAKETKEQVSASSLHGTLHKENIIPQNAITYLL